MELFKELDISPDILKDLESNKLAKPTLVQEKTIPFVFKGRDVLVQSETGSGKTLSFALPSIQIIKKGGGIQVLVIAPTRELAKQVAEEYIKFSKSKGLKVAIVYGGVSINNQIDAVKKCEVVVGTPGRLLDLINRNSLNLSCCPLLIIDEADKLMEMGFIEDVEKMMGHMPKNRQTLMFSATINSQINRIVEKYLKNPAKIILENIIKNAVLKQYYYDVSSKDKISLLVHLLSKKNRGLTLIFAKTKHQTRFLAKVLQKNNLKSDCINGDMSQNLREKVLYNFSIGKIDALIATDVAARGIHIDDITHVINYDLPEDAETYLHRIGRTARSGKKGVAIIILSENDYKNMDKIKKGLKQDIEKQEEKFEKISIGLNRSSSSSGNFHKRSDFRPTRGGANSSSMHKRNFRRNKR